MATRQELRQLASAALKPNANFSSVDANKAFANALGQYIGLNEETTLRDIRHNRELAFAVIEEILDENLPAQLQEYIGMFAEVKTYARDAEPIFTIKGLGKNRVALGIQSGARGGVYRARKLDSKNFAVQTQVETIAYSVTLEEILLGDTTLSEIIAAIAKGFVDRVFMNVVGCLRASYTNLPAANKATAAGIVPATLDGIIRTVSAYGRPVLIAFRSEAEKILNSVPGNGITPNLPVQDLDEIRRQGFVSVYKGTSIVIIPNYFVDETNSKWVFKEQDIFVLPADEKPVKVAVKGDTHVEEAKHAAGGSEWNVHRMIGVGMYFYNSIGIYRDSDNTLGVY